MVNTAKIKGRLRELGKTQSDLARYVGVAVSTMNQKINGERPLDLHEAEMISEYLRISDLEFCNYFFGGNSA